MRITMILVKERRKGTVFCENNSRSLTGNSGSSGQWNCLGRMAAWGATFKGREEKLSGTVTINSSGKCSEIIVSEI